jgi:hypothetical protein
MNHNPGTVRSLRCNCCGGGAGRHAQWWNMDTGFGICRPCAIRQRNAEAAKPVDREDSLEFRCGREGVNWATDEQWAAFEQQ